MWYIISIILLLASGCCFVLTKHYYNKNHWTAMRVWSTCCLEFFLIGIFFPYAFGMVRFIVSTFMEPITNYINGTAWLIIGFVSFVIAYGCYRMTKLYYESEHHGSCVLMGLWDICCAFFMLMGLIITVTLIMINIAIHKTTMAV